MTKLNKNGRVLKNKIISGWKTIKQAVELTGRTKTYIYDLKKSKKVETKKMNGQFYFREDQLLKCSLKSRESNAKTLDRDRKINLTKCEKSTCFWHGKNIFGCDNYSEEFRDCRRSNFKKHYEEK